MKFKTLIDIANDNIDIMITGIKSDGTEIGFDFVKNAWRNDNVFDKNRVVKISELKLLRVYRSFREYFMETFSIVRANTIVAFKDAGRNEKILYVKIFLAPTKTSVRRSLDAKIDKLANKKVSDIENGRKEHEQYKAEKKKKRWSFSPKKTH